MWRLRDGRWGGAGVDNHWVSVDNVAKFPFPPTMDQVLACAQILSRSEKGFGYHHMFGIGDHICPGPAVVAQRDGIVNPAGCGVS